MTTPQVYIAYTPRGVGLNCAVLYLERGDDVFGWWIGARNSDYLTAFFELENFFTTRETRFFATEGSDLYRGWRHVYSPPKAIIDRPSAPPDDVCHELDRAQDVFTREWLHFEGGPDSAAETRAYGELELAVQPVNIRARQLNKLDRSGVVWTYRSHGLEWKVIDHLGRHWPLDYRPE
ncbi:MAG TPA: hypothetical protein VMK05_03580 [Burkholderiales bacterium]|nr:hypothetical protein [Burkholderiales bacterium]